MPKLTKREGKDIRGKREEKGSENRSEKDVAQGIDSRTGGKGVTGKDGLTGKGGEEKKDGVKKKPFEEMFVDRTLRVDYYRVGNRKGDSVMLAGYRDNLSRWAGS